MHERSLSANCHKNLNEEVVPGLARFFAISWSSFLNFRLPFSLPSQRLQPYCPAVRSNILL